MLLTHLVDPSLERKLEVNFSGIPTLDTVLEAARSSFQWDSLIIRDPESAATITTDAQVRPQCYAPKRSPARDTIRTPALSCLRNAPRQIEQAVHEWRQREVARRDDEIESLLESARSQLAARTADLHERACMAIARFICADSDAMAHVTPSLLRLVLEVLETTTSPRVLRAASVLVWLILEQPGGLGRLTMSLGLRSVRQIAR